MKRIRIHFPSRMAKYFKAEHSKSKILVSPRVYTLRFFLFAKAHKKKRKGFESNFSRRNFTNSQRTSSRRVNYFYQLPSELGNRASCKLRKTLVFIRFYEEGTIFKKEKRLKSLFFYEKYGISKFDGYLYKTKRY